MDSMSGHYTPSLENLKYAVNVLEQYQVPTEQIQSFTIDRTEGSFHGNIKDVIKRHKVTFF